MHVTEMYLQKNDGGLFLQKTLYYSVPTKNFHIPAAL